MGCKYGRGGEEDRSINRKGEEEGERERERERESERGDGDGDEEETDRDSQTQTDIQTKTETKKGQQECLRENNENSCGEIEILSESSLILITFMVPTQKKDT